MDYLVQVNVHFSKELQWFRRVHGEYMESTWRVHDLFWFILIRNYNGFVVDMDSLDQADLHFSKELRNFNVFSSGRRLSYTSGYVPLRNRSKRPPVLRDQKVLPEVRNRSLLPREKFKSRTLKKWLRIQ